MSDAIVDRLIALHSKLEEAANSGGSMVDGWRPLRLDNRGWVVAGKNIGGAYRLKGILSGRAMGKAAKYLEIQKEFRS